MSESGPLMPPSEEELAAATSRLAVAKDRLDVEEQAAKIALQRRTDARAEMKNAVASWREMRRQMNSVELFSLDLDIAAAEADDSGADE
jgi:hypothetical protein